MTHHTPLRPLYDVTRHGNLIGYKCDHCGLILTENGQPSAPVRLIQSNPGFQGRYVTSIAHQRRVRAARADRFKKRWERARRQQAA